jgi:hypothetical protein
MEVEEEAENSRMLKEFGPPLPPWLRGSTFEGRPFPKDPRLNFALAMKKEAHFRRKLARTASDEQRAERVEKKAKAVADAARHLKASGFFGGTITPEMLPHAVEEWNEAVMLPGAEGGSESSYHTAKELLVPQVPDDDM